MNKFIIYEKIQNQLNNSQNIYEFLDNLKVYDNKEKGDIFEYLSLTILKEHPYHKKKYKEVYLQKDIPQSINKELTLPNTDKGIDLLAIDHDNNKYSIQCKYRSDTSKVIPWNELSTFPGLSFTCNINKAIYITNCDDICNELKRSTKIENIYGMFWDTYLENDNLLFKQLKIYVKNILENTQININTFYEPKEYQIPIIKASVDYFKIDDNERGQLILACGTGKTLISQFIVTELKYNNIIIAVPSLLLLSQFYLEWYNQNPDMNVLLVGSSIDPDINKFGVQLTTDVQSIRNWIIKNKTKSKVIFTTYQSASEVKDAINLVQKKDILFDICIFDEAHKTAGTESMFNILLEDDNFKVTKRLFLTATPKTYVDDETDEIDETIEVVKINKTINEDNNVKEKYKKDIDIEEKYNKDKKVIKKYIDVEEVDEKYNKDKKIIKKYIEEVEEVEVEVEVEEVEEILETKKYCMNNKKYYGETIYELNMGDAIDKNILTNYQIITPLTTLKMLYESLIENKIKLVDINKNIKYNSETIASAILILKSLKKYPMKKILTYHSNATTTTANKKKGIYDSAYDFSKLLKLLAEKMNIELTCEYMDGTFSMSKRKKILQEMRDSKIPYILSSARVLNEGIDIKCVDTIVFVNSRNSIIDIIQCVGRCLRKYKGKNISNIILPMMVESLDSCDEGTFKEMWKILKGLCCSDETLKAEFTIKEDKFKNKNIKNIKNNKKVRNIIVESLIEKVNLDQWISELKYKCWKRSDFLKYRIREWRIKLDEFMKSLDKNKKRPCNVSTNIIERQLSNWSISQIQHYKNKTSLMKEVEVYDMWTTFINNDNYAIYFITHNDMWRIHLNNLIEYLNNNKKMPLCNSTILYEKKLGIWASTQNYNYKNIRCRMKEPEIYNTWVTFISNPRYMTFFLSQKEYWIKQLRDVMKSMDDTKKRPSKYSKNIIIKQFGGWITVQITNFKEKTQIMSDPEIYDMWAKFISDPTYAHYFISNIDAWKLTFKNVIASIDANKRRPTQHSKDPYEKQMGKWICHQIENYLHKIHIMEEPEIYNIWTAFIKDPNYLKYFLTNVEVWKINLENVIKFLNKNKKRPSSNRKDIIETQLCSWVATQNRNYKQKTEILKNPEIYNMWTTVLNDYKQYF
jgi:superfamily II DNA or RNA helicase